METGLNVQTLLPGELTGYDVIQSVSYLKCDVEISDAIVNQYANITEISQ